MALIFDRIYLLELLIRPLGSFPEFFNIKIPSNSSMEEIQGLNIPSTKSQCKRSCGKTAIRNAQISLARLTFLLRHEYEESSHHLTDSLGYSLRLRDTSTLGGLE